MAKKVLLKDANKNEILPITRGELVLDSSGNPALHSDEFLATTSQPGLMSKEDKYKIDNISISTLEITDLLPNGKKIATISVGSTSYNILAPASYNWDEINNKPTKLSQFTDDVVAGKYLPLSGGDMNNNAVIKFTKYGNRCLTISGNELSFDYSGNSGGWSGGIFLTDSQGSHSLVQWDGDALGLKNTVFKGTLQGNADSANVISKTYLDESINYNRTESKIRLIAGKSANSEELGYPRRYTTGLSVVSSYAGWQMVCYGSNIDYNPYYRSVTDKGVWGSWKQIAFITDIPTKLSQLTNDAGYLTSIPSHTHDYLPFKSLWVDSSSTAFDLNNALSLAKFSEISYPYAGSPHVSNQPWDSAAATVYTLPGNYPLQIAKFYNSNDIRVRGCYGGTWQKWKRLAFTSDIPTSLPANGGNADTVDNLHASDLFRAYGTLGTGNSYDSDWGQSVVTFDPVVNGTYPESNPNVTILNLGNNYARRKQLAFNYNNNNIYFRRRLDSSWQPWVRLALASEIPSVTDYYWANVKVSSSSNAATTPTFATATATTSVTTPTVTNSGILTLNGASGVYLKYNNSDVSSLVLANTYFKPFDNSNNKLSLGTSSARWSNVYSYLGNFAGTVTISCAYPNIVCNASSGSESNIRFEVGGANKGYVGYHNSYGTFLWNSTAAKYVYVADNGYFYTQSYINVGAGNEKNASNPPYVWGVNGSDNFMRTYATSSLSVNYATSAGYTTRLYANSTGDLLTYPGDYSLSYSRFQSNASNIFPVSNNANGCITAHLHSGDYYAQIGLSSNGRMYYRTMMAQTLSAGVGWKTVAWTSDIPTVTDYYWANVKVSASSNAYTSPQFGSVTIYDGTNSCLYLKTTTAGSYAYLAAYNTGGQYGADVVLHSGSALVLGAGESAAAMHSNNVDSLQGSENLYLTADGAVKVFTNCDIIGNRKHAATFDTAGNTAFGGIVNAPAFTVNGASSAGTNYITGPAGRIFFGGNFHIDAVGANHLYLNHYTANNVYLCSGSSQGKVGIRTASPSYPLHVAGDTYTSGWSRAASGFYIPDTGVHFTHQGTLGEIDMTSNNEFLWGSSSADLYFNYRTVSRGTTVTNYIWNAGSSSSYASHVLGNLYVKNVTLSTTLPTYDNAPVQFKSTANNNDASNSRYQPWISGKDSVNSYGYGITVSTGIYRDPGYSSGGYYIGCGWDGNANSAMWKFSRNGYLYGNFSGYLSGTAYSADAIKDSNNGTRITACYSTGGFSSNPSWLAAWNGYHLTYVSPGVLSVNYANSAGNADTLDGLHWTSFARWYGDASTDSTTSDVTSTSTADFFAKIHATSGLFNSRFGAMRGSWWYVGNTQLNTGVGTLEMAGTAVLNLGSYADTNDTYKSLLFLDQGGRLWSYTANETAVKQWSRYVKTTDKIANASWADGASTVTVHDSNSNSTYRMVWHSGNTLYGTGGIYCNPSTDYVYANSFNCGDWFRSSGNTGWYNPTNSCHVYPNATTTYGGLMLRGEKGGYTGFILGTSTNYMNVMDNGTDKGLYQEGKLWILYYNRSNNGVGIRTSTITKDFNVSGTSYLSGKTWIGTTSGNEMLNVGGWVGTTGDTGWYNSTYAGGMYMQDTTYVRTYNGKALYVSNSGQHAIYTAGGFASAKTEGSIFSTYYNGNWYGDTLYTHGNGNLSISAPGGSLYLSYNRGAIYFCGGSYYIDRSGYLYAKAYYETSDERLKNFYQDVIVDFNKLKEIPKKYFVWKTKPNELQIGTSAQVVQNIYPELVSKNANGILNVDYSKLSVIALKGIDELYDMIMELRAENRQLREQIRQLQK